MRRGLPGGPVAFLMLVAAIGFTAVTPRADALDTTPSADLVGPIEARGADLYDAGTGRRVVLRGVAKHRAAEESDLRPDHRDAWTEADVAEMEGWGANVVRVHLSQAYWGPIDCRAAPAYRQRIDDMVRWITDRGMVAVLSLHFTTRWPCDPHGLQRMASNPGSVTFWNEVASRYGSNPLVVFDLFNEPHQIDTATWRNGGVVVDDGIRWRAAGMQRLYETVRRHSGNLVLISGGDWAASATPILEAPVSGHNIAYAVHAYANGEGGRLPDALEGWQQVAATHPVVMSEFGYADRSCGRFLHNAVNWAEANVDGWIAFAWSPWGPYSLVEKWGPDASYATRPTGVAVRAGLQGEPAPTVVPSIRRAWTSPNANATPLPLLDLGVKGSVPEGSLLVAAITTRGGAPAITPPEGWRAASPAVSHGTLQQAVFTKVAGPSEPSSYRWRFGTPATASGVLLRYEGVDVEAPVAASAVQTGDASHVVAAPSVTPSSSTDLLVFVFSTARAAGVEDRLYDDGRDVRDSAAAISLLAGNTTTVADQFSCGGPSGPRVQGFDPPRPAIGIGQTFALRPAG